MPVCRIEGGDLVGEVIGADRFGNLLTSITSSALAGFSAGGGVVFRVGQHRIDGLAGCFADGPPAAPAVIVGSTGRLEVFVKNGSARDLLGGRTGLRVTVRRSGSGSGGR
jgi:S-adenosylmethionine hydrolase